MKNLPTAFLIMSLLMSLSLVGCDELAQQLGGKQQSQQQSQPDKAPEKPHVVHAFQPLAYTGGDLAIDQTTGQKCRTWEFGCECYYTIISDYSKRSMKQHGEIGRLTAERYKQKVEQCNKRLLYGMACEDIENLPTCNEFGGQINHPPNSPTIYDVTAL
jgi:hypothetical protein